MLELEGAPQDVPPYNNFIKNVSLYAIPIGRKTKIVIIASPRPGDMVIKFVWGCTNSPLVINARVNIS